MNPAITEVPLRRWQTAEAIRPEAMDSVAVEEPLELRVQGRGIAVLMRTPGHDRELAAGFLLSEGVIRSADDVVDILLCRTQSNGQEGNVADVLLARPEQMDFARLTRHVFTGSSCGICGKTAIDAVRQAFPALAPGPKFAPAMLTSWPEQLRAAQPGFSATGGAHATALFDSAGAIVLLREDVGRHNAIDKVLGRALLDGRLPLHGHGLLVSGRVSFELVQKALAAGVPLLAGIGAPSSLAVETARACDLTLVGFLRADRMNIYTGAERLE